jgi:CRP-like cAMP-binding protein
LPRIGTPLTTKLERSVFLSSDEIVLLAQLQVPIRTIRRNQRIIREGHKYNELFVLLDGIAIRYRVPHGRRRQIFNIVLPGDFIGFPACFFETALFSIGALTEIQISSIPITQLLDLFGRHRRVAALLLWQFSCEAAMYAEHLVEFGRRSAVERVAHFLLEILTRLRAIGLAEEHSYSMPLTQELIGDVLGLSAAHVNRSLRQLREDGLVTMEAQNVVIQDFARLAEVADFETSYINRVRINEALAEG